MSIELEPRARRALHALGADMSRVRRLVEYIATKLADDLDYVERMDAIDADYLLVEACRRLYSENFLEVAVAESYIPSIMSLDLDLMARLGATLHVILTHETILEGHERCVESSDPACVNARRIIEIIDRMDNIRRLAHLTYHVILAGSRIVGGTIGVPVPPLATYLAVFFAKPSITVRDFVSELKKRGVLLDMSTVERIENRDALFGG